MTEFPEISNKKVRPPAPKGDVLPTEFSKLVRYATIARLSERVGHQNFDIVVACHPENAEIVMDCLLPNSQCKFGLRLDFRTIPDDARGIWGTVEYAALMIAQQINAVKD